MATLSAADVEFWAATSLYHLCAILLTILMIIHCKKAFFDLYIYRDQKSKIIKSKYQSYVLLVSLSLLVVIFNTLQQILSAITSWRIFGIEEYCVYYFSVTFIVYIMSKLAMYSLFIERLHLAYDGSAIYQYNRKTLIISILCITICLIIYVIITLFYIKSFTNIKNKYIIECDASIPAAIFIFGGFIDTFICILCLIAFTKPLKRVIDFVYSHSDLSHKDEETKLQNLLQLGTKLQIVTGVASISTLVFLLSVAFFDSVILLGIDSVINSVSVMLLTDYYQDYYPKLCCCCIKCHNKIQNCNISIKRKNKSGSEHTFRSQKSSTVPYLQSSFQSSEIDNTSTQVDNKTKKEYGLKEIVSDDNNGNNKDNNDIDAIGDMLSFNEDPYKSTPL